MTPAEITTIREACERLPAQTVGCADCCPAARTRAAAARALPAALDEIERLRGMLVEACDIGRPHADLNGDQKDVRKLDAIRAEGGCK